MSHSSISAAQYPAIVLAGGLGTRLRSVVQDLPKPMAAINGKPFLHYLFLYLTRQHIHHAILCVGYKSKAIESYFGDKYLDVKITYSHEAEPLGTGGAIQQAFSQVNDKAFVLNGDTFFDIELAELMHFAVGHHADLAMALKPMQKFDRYGVVRTDEKEKITAFEEKRWVEQGTINGGIYFMDKSVFAATNHLSKFSFEKEILEQKVATSQFYGKAFEHYFIDIGIPEDFARAQHDFAQLFGL
jgi:D-glycero-alpha-D-manno-heptose 1-phosphate guanylyltransferase